jgi:hypothetical protein
MTPLRMELEHHNGIRRLIYNNYNRKKQCSLLKDATVVEAKLGGEWGGWTFIN